MKRMSAKKRQPKYDLISVGDSWLDVFLDIDDATLSCELKKEQCLLCFDYADKIPVNEVVSVPGAGNASNAAVGGRRLGMKTAVVSVLGNDDTGDEIVKHWKKEKVGTEYVTRDTDDGTNYATVLNFKGERTQLIHSEDRKYVLPKLGGTKWIYYTAIGPNHEKQERQLLKYLKDHPKVKLAFNPGNNQLTRGLKSLEPMIKRSDLFIVNREEGMHLLEAARRPIHNLLFNYHHIGAKNIVITDGPKGSYGTDGKEIWFHPIFPGPVKERTGAGDSFTIGMLYGLYSKKKLPVAMGYGTANAWSVVQKVGPQAGLLKKTEMDKIRRKFSKYKPKMENHLKA